MIKTKSLVNLERTPPPTGFHLPPKLAENFIKKEEESSKIRDVWIENFF
jgi:hypothetical protein